MTNTLAFWIKFWEQTLAITFTNQKKKKFNIAIYFENIIVKLYVIYIFNMYVKFRTKQMLFTIWSTNMFFIHDFKL